MVTHRVGYFFTREDLVVDLNHETKDIPSSAFGPLTQVRQGVKATAKFRPVGEFEHLGVLWPYANAKIGSSIFGDADYPLLIQPLDPAQPQTTFHAAGLSKMPDLNFTATDTLIGDCEFQMVGKNNTAAAAADRLFLQENNAIDPDALPYSDAALKVQAYANRWLSAGTRTLTFGGNTTAPIAYNATAAAVAAALNAIASIAAAGGVTAAGNYVDGYTVTFDDNGNRGAITGAAIGMPSGSTIKATVQQEGTAGLPEIVLLQDSPWGNFETREGMKVSFAMTLTEDSGDAIGHYDTVFGGLTVRASGLPQGVTEAQMLAAAGVQGPTSVRGRRLSEGAHDLDISGEGVFFRMYAANLRKAGLVYGATKQRVPDLEWAASRTIGAGGALNPLFYIGTAAPV